MSHLIGLYLYGEQYNTTREQAITFALEGIEKSLLKRPLMEGEFIQIYESAKGEMRDFAVHRVDDDVVIEQSDDDVATENEQSSNLVPNYAAYDDEEEDDEQYLGESTLAKLRKP